MNSVNSLLLAALSISPGVYVDYEIADDGSVAWWVADGPGELPPPKHATLESALTEYVKSRLAKAKEALQADIAQVDRAEKLVSEIL